MSDEDPNVDNVKKVVIPPNVKVCPVAYIDTNIQYLGRVLRRS